MSKFSKLTVIMLLWLQWAGILVFLYGFFPVKTPLDGYADQSDIPDNIRQVFMCFYVNLHRLLLPQTLAIFLIFIYCTLYINNLHFATS